MGLQVPMASQPDATVALRVVLDVSLTSIEPPRQAQSNAPFKTLVLRQQQVEACSSFLRKDAALSINKFRRM